MTDITIPDEVVPAMKLAAAEYVANGKDFTEEGLFTAALRAGLAAWPGMFPTEMEEAAGVRRRIILPLPPQETSDAEFLNRYWTELNWDTDDADFDRLFALARRGAAAGDLLEALKLARADVVREVYAYARRSVERERLLTRISDIDTAITRFEALTTQEKDKDNGVHR